MQQVPERYHAKRVCEVVPFIYIYILIMNDIQKRFFLFLVFCLPVRIFITLLARKATPEQLRMMGRIALVPALGMIYLYITKSRQTGVETQGGEIWWKNMRPLYALLYFSFAYMALNENKNAYKALALDIVVGFTTFVMYHYSEGNFKKLLTN
jgi:hypothetical protein